MRHEKKLRVLIAAGGSGGHLFPAQQLASLLKSDSDISFAGHKLQESPFFEREKIPFWEIASAPPKKGNWLRFCKESLKGLWQSLRLLKKISPDVVVGFGSYHTFPTLLAATLLQKKLVLFEANSMLGKVNRLFLPAAKKVALQFPLERRLLKETFVPYFPWVSSPKKKMTRIEARRTFNLAPDRFTFLVFGGSQGATFLNEVIPKALLLLKRVDFQVIHLTGKGHRAGDYGQIPHCVKEFESQMDLAYTASDLAICRSGAGTMAELIRSEIPALLIPFPYAADNHQWRNGQFLTKKVGGARLLEQAVASPQRVAAELQILLEERDALKKALAHWNLMERETTDFGDLVRSVGETR